MILGGQTRYSLDTVEDHLKLVQMATPKYSADSALTTGMTSIINGWRMNSYSEHLDKDQSKMKTHGY